MQTDQWFMRFDLSESLFRWCVQICWNLQAGVFSEQKPGADGETKPGTDDAKLGSLGGGALGGGSGVGGGAGAGAGTGAGMVQTIVAGVLKRRALVLIERGQSSEAQVLFMQVVRAGRDRAKVHLADGLRGLGLVEMIEGRWLEAQHTFEDALRVARREHPGQPDHPQVIVA